MKKNHKTYFIFSLIIFILAVCLNIFQDRLVYDQAELMITIGSEKKEKFEKELWAFRIANKVYGWGVFIPRKTQSEAFDVIRRVERDTKINAYIVLFIYILSVMLAIIGLFKKRQFNKRLNKISSTDG